MSPLALLLERGANSTCATDEDVDLCKKWLLRERTWATDEDVDLFDSERTHMGY